MSDSSIWNLPRRFSPTVLLESHTRRFGIKVVDIVQRCRQIVRLVIVTLPRRLNEKLLIDCLSLRFATTSSILINVVARLYVLLNLTLHPQI